MVRRALCESQSDSRSRPAALLPHITVGRTNRILINLARRLGSHPAAASVIGRAAVVAATVISDARVLLHRLRWRRRRVAEPLRTRRGLLPLRHLHLTPRLAIAQRLERVLRELLPVAVAMVHPRVLR